METMDDDFEEVEVPLLELCAYDKSNPPPARIIAPAQKLQTERAIEQAFTHGGFVSLRVLRPKNPYIKELCMDFLPNQFRITALTNDENPKNGWLEWWNPAATEFQGTIRFGDDDWDARTVSSEVAVAKKFFYELYEHGELSHELLLTLRSGWNPMPR